MKRRLLRHGIRTVAMVSLLLCALSAALWVRSYWRAINTRWGFEDLNPSGTILVADEHEPAHMRSFECSRGRILLTYTDITPDSLMFFPLLPADQYG